MDLTKQEDIVDGQQLTEEDENLLAVTQLLHDLSVIKSAAYKQNMNPILLMEVKMAARGTLTKYQKAGFFEGESLEISIRDRKNFQFSNLVVKYSAGLYELVRKCQVRVAQKLEKPVEQ